MSKRKKKSQDEAVPEAAPDNGQEHVSPIPDELLVDVFSKEPRDETVDYFFSRLPFDQRWAGAQHTFGKLFQEHVDKNPAWPILLALELIRDSVVSLREDLDRQGNSEEAWKSASIEVRFPISWSWERNRFTYDGWDEDGLKDFESAAETAASTVVQGLHTALFQALTLGAIVARFPDKDGRPGTWERHTTKDTEGYLKAHPEVDFSQAWEPFSFFGPDENANPLPRGPRDAPTCALEAHAWIRGLVSTFSDRLAKGGGLSVNGEVDGAQYSVGLHSSFWPLTLDGVEKAAFYPLVTVIQGDGAFWRPWEWSPASRASLWNAFLETLDGVSKFVAHAFSPKQKEEKEEKGAEEQRELTLNGQPLPLEDFELVDTEDGGLRVMQTPPPSEKHVPTTRSVMSPVLMPRGGLEKAAGQALLLEKSFTRKFSGYHRLPNLDLTEDLAVREAETLFFSALEDALSKALPEPPLSWEKHGGKDEPTVYELEGMNAQEASQLWAEVVSSLNAEKGGPGVQVEDPQVKDLTAFRSATGDVAKRASLTLWPKEATKSDKKPVRFRRSSSPGYLALIERQGTQPYLADGYVWFRQLDGEHEGYRLDGMAMLLYPEGVKALRQVWNNDAQTAEKELSRIYYTPSLFKSEDRKLEETLLARIRAQKTKLAHLSLYEDGQDLLRCIFEAFARQKDAWAAKRLALPDGPSVSTEKIGAFIYLDPEDLKVRLDPRGEWGDNWRARLFEKLRVFTTLERVIRDARGKDVDVGDRFLRRVVDGLREREKGDAGESASVGLTKLLRDGGLIPSRYFFVELSREFLGRFFLWTHDSKGRALWGVQAAAHEFEKALQAADGDAKKARKETAHVKKEAKSKAYFMDSPRLLTIGNLEKWRPSLKHLAWIILQEQTPNRVKSRRKPNRLGGGEALAVIGDRDYMVCGGSKGYGYRVKEWLKKAAYERRAGPRGGQQALQDFTEDLGVLVSSPHIALRLQVKGQAWPSGNILGKLEAARNNPTAVYDLVLVALLPHDLESQLRDRLAEGGIDATDEDERLTPPALRPLAKDGTTPLDLRAARVQAGMSQEELAKKLGVSKMAVSLWESGKKKVTERRLQELRQALGKHLEEGR